MVVDVDSLLAGKNGPVLAFLYNATMTPSATKHVDGQLASVSCLYLCKVFARVCCSSTHVKFRSIDLLALFSLMQPLLVIESLAALY